MSPFFPSRKKQTVEEFVFCFWPCPLVRISFMRDVYLVDVMSVNDPWTVYLYFFISVLLEITFLRMVIEKCSKMKTHVLLQFFVHLSGASVALTWLIVQNLWRHFQFSFMFPEQIAWTMKHNSDRYFVITWKLIHCSVIGEHHASRFWPKSSSLSWNKALSVPVELVNSIEFWPRWNFSLTFIGTP